MKIILASNSPRRRELLKYLNVNFEIMPSNSDENFSIKKHSKLVKAIANEKAKDVFNKTSGDRVVIGADTIVCLNNKILKKPVNEEDSYKTLNSLSGKKHLVYTGLSVYISKNGKDKNLNLYKKSKIYFNKLSKFEIDNYIKTGDPKDKAGSYSIQGPSAVFVKKINGDYYSVMGLPINLLYNIFKKESII